MTGLVDMPQRLRAWSYRRQQLDQAAPEPAEALRRVVAVYSSHPTAPLSLLSRSRSFHAEWLGAMEQRRALLRLPAMRQSIFLMPAEAAPRLFAATRQPVERRAASLRYAGLSWDEYARLKVRVFEQLREPMTAADTQRALKMDARLMTALRLMAYEGLVLRLGTSLRTDSLRYVSTEAWLGHPLEEADPLESLQWLAEEYLRSFGPARARDFAWWSGVSSRRASEALGGGCAVDIGGGLLLPGDQQAAFASVAPLDPEAVAVLPKWDAYTMGYAPDGRQRLVDDAYLGSAYSKVGGAGATAGDGLPLVLRGGRAVATWSHRFEGNRMLVKVTPFAPGAAPLRLYERNFDEVGRLLGATALEVDFRVNAPASKN